MVEEYVKTRKQNMCWPFPSGSFTLGKPHWQCEGGNTSFEKKSGLERVVRVSEKKSVKETLEAKSVAKGGTY